MSLREVHALRRRIREGKFNSPTAGHCKGFVQANLVAIPEKFREDFEFFCMKNPKPCPLLEVIGPGSYITKKLAKDADLRTEIPKYKIFIDGKEEYIVENILDFYRNDLVFFLIGCSFTFENAMLKAGINLTHIERKKNVSMYNTDIKLKASGMFSGNMVVSMRPIHYSNVVEACLITARFPEMHGAPVHVGYPEMIGIKDIRKVDYGDRIVILDSEIPLFWACGVTPQNILLHAKIPIAITHYPGHMFVTDLKDDYFYKDII